MQLQFLIHPLERFGAACVEHTFFGLPVWYHYLNAAGKMTIDPATGRCEFVSLRAGFQVQDMALVGLAIIDILLRVSALIAIGYVMYGGFRMISAQGEPDSIKRAQQTMWNALIGLGISIASIGGVAFIGKAIH
jgi:hypothetical protein